MNNRGRIYLAGGIFGLTDADAVYWRAFAKERLAAAGFDVVDPLELGDYRGLEFGRERDVVEGDLEALRSCALVLAACLRPSWGTAMELREARGLRIPVVGFCDLSAPVSPWLRYHCARLYPDLTAALEGVITGAALLDRPGEWPIAAQRRRGEDGSPELARALDEVRRLDG